MRLLLIKTVVQYYNISNIRIMNLVKVYINLFYLFYKHIISLVRQSILLYIFFNVKFKTGENVF